MFWARPNHPVGHQVDPAAEAELRAWAHAHRDEEEAAFDREEVVVPAGDDGRDRHDPADAPCLAIASSTPGERDPNAQIFDQYTGTEVGA